MRTLLEKFITENIDNAYRFALLYTKNREDAEDVVNESVIKALCAVKSLKNPQNMKTWFYKIIINTAYTYQKKKKREQPSEIPPDTASANDDYLRVTLGGVLEKLSEEQRMIIVLRFFEDMKISSIAKLLSVNENTAKTRLYRAVEALRREYER